jgi:hypothetical protein
MEKRDPMVPAIFSPGQECRLFRQDNLAGKALESTRDDREINPGSGGATVLVTAVPVGLMMARFKPLIQQHRDLTATGIKNRQSGVC